MSDHTLDVLDGRWSFNTTRCAVCGEALHDDEGQVVIDPTLDSLVCVCPTDDERFGYRDCEAAMYTLFPNIG